MRVSAIEEVENAMHSTFDLYRVELSYAVFGVEVRGGVVVGAAPIGRWMVGKALSAVRSWVRGKGGYIVEVDCCAPVR